MASCRGGGDAPKPTADDSAKEQARFDAERHPEKIVEALGIAPGARVADIGAGSGLLTVHLARAVAPNGKVVATDIDGGVELYRNARQLNADFEAGRKVADVAAPDDVSGARDSDDM